MLWSRNSAQKIGLVHGLKVIVRKKYYYFPMWSSSISITPLEPNLEKADI